MSFIRDDWCPHKAVQGEISTKWHQMTVETESGVRHLYTEGCQGLPGIPVSRKRSFCRLQHRPPNSYVGSPDPSVPGNVILFGGRVFKLK